MVNRDRAEMSYSGNWKVVLELPFEVVVVVVMLSLSSRLRFLAKGTGGDGDSLVTDGIAPGVGRDGKIKKLIWAFQTWDGRRRRATGKLV